MFYKHGIQSFLVRGRLLPYFTKFDQVKCRKFKKGQIDYGFGHPRLPQTRKS